MNTRELTRMRMRSDHTARYGYRGQTRCSDSEWRHPESRDEGFPPLKRARRTVAGHTHPLDQFGAEVDLRFLMADTEIYVHGFQASPSHTMTIMVRDVVDATALRRGDYNLENVSRAIADYLDNVKQAEFWDLYDENQCPERPTGVCD